MVTPSGTTASECTSCKRGIFLCETHRGALETISPIFRAMIEIEHQVELARQHQVELERRRQLARKRRLEREGQLLQKLKTHTATAPYSWTNKPGKTLDQDSDEDSEDST